MVHLRGHPETVVVRHGVCWKKVATTCEQEVMVVQVTSLLALMAHDYKSIHWKKRGEE